MQAAMFDFRIGAAGTGMNAIAGLSERLAIDDVDVIGNLRGDAVAIVVASDAVPDGYVAHVVHIDGAAATPVEVGVFGFVAVHRDVLEGHILRVFRAQDGIGIADAGVLRTQIVITNSWRIDLHHAAVYADDFRNEI